jgi:hypothetical protein
MQALLVRVGFFSVDGVISFECVFNSTIIGRLGHEINFNGAFSTNYQRGGSLGVRSLLQLSYSATPRISEEADSSGHHL